MKPLESKLYVAGHCLSFSAATFKDGPWKPERYPAICALIRHPEHGDAVFDTGYSRAFHEATKRLPNRMYSIATPVRLKTGESLAEQLRADGINPENIASVVLSHLHADHVGGLRDFPNARIIVDAAGSDALTRLKGFRAVRKGFIRELLPDDFDARRSGILHRRQVRLEPEMEPFRVGYDLFGDGSLVAVYLHGHAFGQVGLLYEDMDRGRTFLCADAAWSRRAIRENVGPGLLGYFAVDDRRETDGNLRRLHELHASNPSLRIVPSHCQEVWAEIEADRA